MSELSFDEAVALLPDRETVHTFLQGACVLGADWTRDQTLEAIRERGVQLAGPIATEMHHGLVITEYDNLGSLFIETK